MFERQAPLSMEIWHRIKLGAENAGVENAGVENTGAIT